MENIQLNYWCELETPFIQKFEGNSFVGPDFSSLLSFQGWSLPNTLGFDLDIFWHHRKQEFSLFPR